MNKPATLAQKLRVMEQLRKMGINDEKAIAAVDVEELLITHQNIQAPELRIITSLKKAVKSNKLYSYLQGEDPEKNKTEQEEKHNGPC